MFQNGAAFKNLEPSPNGMARIDIRAPEPNNCCMSRSEVVRRVKSYSSATGYVFQYYFYETQQVRRGSVAGTEYVYMVSRDRKKVFPLRILVQRDAVDKWSKTVGRPLSGTEEYAVAKMRLFQALDEIEDIETNANLVVDESNLNSLLAGLDV